MSWSSLLVPQLVLIFIPIICIQTFTLHLHMNTATTFPLALTTSIAFYWWWRSIQLAQYVILICSNKHSLWVLPRWIVPWFLLVWNDAFLFSVQDLLQFLCYWCIKYIHALMSTLLFLCLMQQSDFGIYLLIFLSLLILLSCTINNVILNHPLINVILPHWHSHLRHPYSMSIHIFLIQLTDAV